MLKLRHRKLIATLATALLIAPSLAASPAAAARADSPPPNAAFAAVVPEATRVRRGRRDAAERGIRWAGRARQGERRTLRQARWLAARMRQVWSAVLARGPPDRRRGRRATGPPR